MAIEQGVTTERKLLGQKLINYLAANPKELDVTFLVGPEKKEIQSLKIALKAACPALDKLFKEKWDTDLVRGEIGIPLPSLDPAAFQIFVDLLLSDDWSAEEIEAMELPAKTILNLLNLSKEFKMNELENVFQSQAVQICLNYEHYSKTDEFLELSCENLELVLGSDLLAMDEIDIFKSACEWAENKCTTNGLEPTGQNLRDCLGSVFYKIRFPIMNHKDIASVVRSKKVLTNDEQLWIFNYIALGKHNEEHCCPYSMKRRNNYDNLTARVPIVIFSKQDGILNFFKNVRVVDNPSFICDGVKRRLCFFSAFSRVVLESIGFLGPVNGNATYEVAIQVWRCPPNISPKYPKLSQHQLIDSMQKKVEAKQGQIFHVSFENPVLIEADVTQQKNYFKKGKGFYYINVSLKGPNIQTAQFLNGSKCKDLLFKVGGTAFYTEHHSDQMAEIKFSKC